jgi:hypothetical protein
MKIVFDKTTCIFSNIEENTTFLYKDDLYLKVISTKDEPCNAVNLGLGYKTEFIYDTLVVPVECEVIVK